jgi:hypothetical protein
MRRKTSGFSNRPDVCVLDGRVGHAFNHIKRQRAH